MLLSSTIVGLVALAVGTKADTATSSITTGSGGASATATSTSSTAAATHSIAVGAVCQPLIQNCGQKLRLMIEQSGFVLEPHEVTNASVGDIIGETYVQLERCPT